jgi:hypothetical protein
MCPPHGCPQDLRAADAFERVNAVKALARDLNRLLAPLMRSVFAILKKTSPGNQGGDSWQRDKTCRSTFWTSR